MIFVLIRVLLRWLKYLGFNVPQMPSLLRRQFLLEQVISPPTTPKAPRGPRRPTPPAPTTPPASPGH